MKNLKCLTIPAYLFPIGAIASIIALIVAFASCTGEGFGMASLPLVAALTVATALFGFGVLFFSATQGDKLISTACAFMMVVTLSACVYLMIYGKADVFGTVLFSDLEKGYAPAERASNLGLASIVIYLISLLTIMIASFFRLDRKNEK